jgi:hypothetical protein
MTRRLLLVLKLVVCFSAGNAFAQSRAYTPPASPRATYNFNPGWKLFVGDPAEAQSADFDDSSWRTVTLPHAWNEDAAFKVSIAQHPTGIAWYRKHFKLPADAGDKKVFLEFEGIRQAGEFYLNGRFIGRHENGITAFGFDITGAVKAAPAENVLAVRIDNDWDYREKSTGVKFQWANRNFNANYGGIPKNVKLHLTGKLYQTLPLFSQLGTVGSYIYAGDFDVPGKSALVTAEAQIKNEDNASRTIDCDVVIQAMDGTVVKTFASDRITIGAGETQIVSASARVQGLEFWSWGYGYLYNVYTILKSDGRVIDVVCTRTGFRKTEFGHGVVKLNDRVLQMKGYAQRTSNEWPAMGSAVPAWLSDFSNGLIVQGNGNLIRWMHITPSKQDVESCDRMGLIESMPAGDAESDVGGRQWQQRVEVMRDAIIYNRNDPSIVFYESGNTGVSEEHMRQMKAVRDKYDPHGGRAAGCREMLDSQVAEYGGEMLYINKSARLPFWAMEYSRDEGLRKYWDEFSPPFHRDGDGPPYRNAPAREYNRNQDSFAIEDVTRWFDYWRERPGTGARVSAGGVNIIFSDSNTHFRGAENYRRSGEVDAMRIPKDGFRAHEVIWDGWVDIERPRICVLGHWNYAPGTRKNVYVVSSAEKVKLFLNDKPLGEGIQTNRFLFTFPDVEWFPGTLKAVGLDAGGKQLCETEVRTAGEPAAVKLSAFTGPDGLRADGADVALVEVEVVDASGRRCPTALSPIDFELDGPAEWRGGIAQGPDNFILSKHLPVECGVNRVLIRSRPDAGKIVLTAKSDGLKSATLELESKSVEVHDGLASALPGANLPSNLRRGPTPSGPSFTPTRTAVPIIGVTAGANADQAMATIDDNERTLWTSGNTLATAWIRYQFGREARPTEIVLKLSGWRERSYPLRILVDDEEVFRGNTPRSLGYITLPLRPVKGRSLKIELTGAATRRSVSESAELEKPRNASTGDERISGGTLGIAEFECYEPLIVSGPQAGTF